MYIKVLGQQVRPKLVVASNMPAVGSNMLRLLLRCGNECSLDVVEDSISKRARVGMAAYPNLGNFGLLPLFLSPFLLLFSGGVPLDFV